MTKKAYIAPSMVVEHVELAHMLAASGINNISGADGLNYNGATDDAGITTCNVKNNDWTDIWE